MGKSIIQNMRDALSGKTARERIDKAEQAATGGSIPSPKANPSQRAQKAGTGKPRTAAQRLRDDVRDSFGYDK